MLSVLTEQLAPLIDRVNFMRPSSYDYVTPAEQYSITAAGRAALEQHASREDYSLRLLVPRFLLDPPSCVAYAGHNLPIGLDISLAHRCRS